MNTMAIEEIIDCVTKICKNNNIDGLKLFGSFATNTATSTSDIDFVVFGCKNFDQLQKEIDEILTLRKIDILDYDSIHNPLLLEDIEKYGKQIY